MRSCSSIPSCHPTLEDLNDSPDYQSHRPGRPPRLERIFQRYDPPLYFVTICSRDRRHLFANDSFHEAFRYFANYGYTERQIALGRYVLMPDHLHLFVRGPQDFHLSEWIRGLKRTLSQSLTASGNTPSHWQRGFFDHVIRSSESYDEKWFYVWQNPVRARLVSDSAEWPWQGEIVHIDRV